MYNYESKQIYRMHNVGKRQKHQICVKGEDVVSITGRNVLKKYWQIQ